MLDGFQPLYTPGSRRLYHFEFHGEHAQLTAEIRRTLEAIAAATRARVAKGSISIEEAELVMALWRAIAADFEHQDRWLSEGSGASGWSLAEKLRELRQQSGVAWSTKVKAVRREITSRRKAYPGQVDKGQLTSADAKAQLERLEAIHDCYWRHGYAFDGTAEELRALGEIVADSNLHEQKVAA